MSRYDDDGGYEEWKDECERRSIDAAYARNMDWVYKTGQYEIDESNLTEDDADRYGSDDDNWRYWN